jgi:hypothetical protein
MVSIARIRRISNRVRSNVWWLLANELQSLQSSEGKMVDNAIQHANNLMSYCTAQEYLPLSNKTYNSEINRHELQVYSQNGEDGILLYLFSKVGVTDYRFVEFGCGDGRECNTANLSVNFGWNGLLMDGNENNIATARKFYQGKLGENGAVKIQRQWITAEDINDLILNANISGEIDLLSIDIDGNDYWVWKAIDVINPRVVVIEYNAAMGTDEAITVKYDPEFDVQKKHPTQAYFGASLLALTKLGKTKGYILAGCCSHGVNAFFVRKDVADEKIAESEAEKAYYPLYTAGPFSQTRYLGVDYV